ncbi:hypothetical protein AB0A76_18230 [Streptomyces exfoliatus]|uniref:Uncharacterized protein n=1 Tax=Streptomyces exfoliatus TaxID=1905 RepID=A0ABV3CZS8_STREX
MEQTVAELAEARGHGKYLDDVPDVWTAAIDGRVRRLVGEDGLVLAGRITEDGRKPELADVPKPVTVPNPKPGIEPPARTYCAATDTVEQLVDHAINSDAQVLFVPDSTVPSGR